MTPQPDIVCFSHLRWDFVYQRPQHLLSRFAANRRVFFVEEPQPLPIGSEQPRMDVVERTPMLSVLVPRVPASLAGAGLELTLRDLLDEHIARAGIRDFVAWY